MNPSPMNPSPMNPESKNPASPITMDLNPRSHFKVHYHAAIFLFIDHLRRATPTTEVGDVLQRHPFLLGYVETTTSLLPHDISWAEARAWWATAIAEWEAAHPTIRLPLRSLSRLEGFDFVARMQLLMAGLVEEDSRFGPLVAEAAGQNRRRPTLELLAAITAGADPTEGAPAGGMSTAAATARHLVDLGVFHVPNRDDPRSDWIAHLPPELWDALVGEPSPKTPPWLTVEPHASLPSFDDMVVPDDLAADAAAVPALIMNRSVDLIVLRGARGSDRISLLKAVAQGTNNASLHINVEAAGENFWDTVGPLATALDALIILETDPAPGATLARRPIRGYTSPLMVTLSDTGGIAVEATDRAVTIEFPLLSLTDRKRRWAAAFGDHHVNDLDQISREVRLQGAHIDRAANGAVVAAALDGADAVGLEHVRSASRQLNRQLLDTLATHLDPTGSWEDLIVGDFTMTRLAELEARCQHRENLTDRLSATYSAETGVGVRALFTGGSGTGKTLTARVLGRQLGLDVYRVDLAAIVDKYIGETEKNLHQVLSTAEELDVLLLIDEGDSLLGRRTEVNSSNDRFANLETNYLLQRLEAYRGIVVVTTNAADNIDPAFQRRMDVVVSFVPPSAPERLDIWQLHLPDDHRVPARYLEDLATRCELTGGQIRNAVMHAALDSLTDAEFIEMHHVERAVASEYQKAGSTSPFDPSGRTRSASASRVFQEMIP